MTKDEEIALRARVEALSAAVMALHSTVRALCKSQRVDDPETIIARCEDVWLGQNVTDNEIRLAKVLLRDFLE